MRPGCWWVAAGLVACLFGCESARPKPASRAPPPTRARARAEAEAGGRTNRLGAPPPQRFYIARLFEHGGTRRDASGRLIPTYQVRLQYPEFLGSPFVDLNRLLESLVRRVDQDFSGRCEGLGPQILAAPALPWRLESRFSVPHTSDTLVSVLLEVAESTGDTRPSTGFVTVNYAVPWQQPLSLAGCLTSAHALGTLAEWVMADLSARPDALTDPDRIQRGAGPQWENYANFTFTPGALVVHFAPGQVQAEAGGPRSVAIPWERMRGLLQPEILALWRKE